MEESEVEDIGHLDGKAATGRMRLSAVELVKCSCGSGVDHDYHRSRVAVPRENRRKEQVPNIQIKNPLLNPQVTIDDRRALMGSCTPKRLVGNVALFTHLAHNIVTMMKNGSYIDISYHNMDQTFSMMPTTSDSSRGRHFCVVCLEKINGRNKLLAHIQNAHTLATYECDR